MNPDFKAAAEAGDLNMLYAEIKKDPYVLEKIDKIPFVDTPLHIAAAAGQIRFATEIIRLMPSFAQKLNEEGLSSLHLAIQNVGMMYRFLSISKDLVRLKGREGLTPLHFAAESGNVAILAVLLSACPDSIEDFSVEGETALHIAGKMGHFDALRILVEWLQKYHSSQSRSRILNWKNESGETVLHVSARRNVDAQTVQLLIENGMNLNIKNSGGSTVLDIVEMPQFANVDIRKKLLDAQAKCGTDITNPQSDPSLEGLKWMSRDLKVAAVAGDLKMLYELIEIDPYVLENIDKIPFLHTPLHIAAAAGHIRFATEIIRLMPSFGQKLNEQGLSPMHLALQNVDMVRCFLSINKELVRVKGRKGLTPLHSAAASGNVAILAVLLAACPYSIEDFTVEDETALHIAVRKRHFEALQVLVGSLWMLSSDELSCRILNCKNISGDTILHVSTRMNDAQIVKFLIKERVHLNEKNSEGLTALDIGNTNIKNMLLSANAKPGTNVADTPSLAEKLKPGKLTILDRIVKFIALRKTPTIDEGTRNALLVVTVLIATMTYQSALNPPGGLFPADTSTDSTNTTSSRINASTNSTNSTCSQLNATSLNNCTEAGNTLWGKSVMPHDDFAIFWIFNTVTLLASIVEIFLLLISKMLFHFPLSIALSAFWFCYLYAMDMISPSSALPGYHLFWWIPHVIFVLLILLVVVKKNLQATFAEWKEI